MTTIRVQLDQDSLQKIARLETLVQNIDSKLNSANDKIETDRFLRIDDVAEIVGFNKKWIYEEIQKGNFPSPTKFGVSSRWKLSDIKNWVDSH